MEEAKITVKRIDSFKFKDGYPPMIVILSDKNFRYHYQHGSSEVSPTLEYLIVTKPGDELNIRYSVKKAFLDKDSIRKIFSAELISN
jgi:hypothetical protein